MTTDQRLTLWHPRLPKTQLRLKSALAVLGLRYPANPYIYPSHWILEDSRQRYHKLIRLYHTDTGGSAEEHLAITLAYTTICKILNFTYKAPRGVIYQKKYASLESRNEAKAAAGRIGAQRRWNSL